MYYLKSVKFILFLFIFINFLFSQSVVINEIMSSNSLIINDEDGDSPDWIELYNNSDSSINLAGYGLSDDLNEIGKWIIPNITINPKNHLLIFASGKNRCEFKNTIINRGDSWNYKIGTGQVLSNWTKIDYNDSEWLQGATGIGYGDDDDSTTIPINTVLLYARKVFDIDNLDEVKNIILSIDYDDAFVAYINGVEITRSNITGNPPQSVITDHEALLYQNLQIENFQIDNISEILIEGENLLAIEVHNVSSGSSDLTFIPYLTLSMSEKMENIQVSDDLIFTSESLHTNFKINSDGETIILSDPTGSIVNQKDTGVLPLDISIGRKPDGGENWLFFSIPTPGSSNSTEGFNTLSSSPIFSKEAGFYETGIQISLSVESGNSPIYYTTDCSEPTINSTKYTNPFYVTETSVIRAICIESNSLSGPIITKTYLINTSHDLPVISLSTNPPNLWSPDSGIYVLGNDFNESTPNYGANFWEDWERPVHIELFESEGTLGLDIDAGMKIFGGWSRSKPEKSLAIFARNKYGYSEIPYQIFPDKNIFSFQSFVLRNSANDFEYTMFRDGFMQSIINGSNIDDQAYRPSVVYLNGEYWGIHNIREKLNEHYVASHHDVDPDNIDLLESNGHANHGDSNDWFEFINYIETHDLQIAENYDSVNDQIDILNFIEYNVAQIYFDNTDWPGNNIKYWKEKSENGKWRWILFDTDFGFGLYSDQRYKYNTLAFATNPNGDNWPNPPWSTLLLRKLLENDDFKHDFINCFCDNLNTRFLFSNVEDKLNEAKQRIESEIENHINKWKQGNNSPGIGSINTWKNNINIMRDFGKNRQIYSYLHLKQKFSLDNLATLNLNILPENAGFIKINTIEINNPNWNGQYFRGIPIQVDAIPNPGYQFKNWTDGIVSTESNIDNIILNENMSLTCNFELGSSNDQNIVINEINYSSSDDFNTEDWVEIYNNSGNTISLNNWIFKDSDDSHSYKFPTNIQLQANEYIVLVNDRNKFSNLFPNVTNILGDFDFGLSKNDDMARLYNSNNELIDSVNYNAISPWPTESTKTGSTIILKDPNLDNTIPQNWVSSEKYGSPGEANFQTQVNETENIIPDKYSLHQNFPNPFNSSTIIPFSILKVEKLNC